MIIPFLNFAGQATEAIALYESVFEVTDKKVMYYKEMPTEMLTHFPPETHGYVMHAEMLINGTQVWIGDSSQGITPGDMVSIAVPLPTEEAVKTAFEKLKVGGTVLMELEPTFYSPLFGVIKDRFGVVWHIICQPSH